MMNYILGGAPFISHIGRSVRENEGLAYSVGSRLGSNYFYPASFYISLQTKQETFFKAVSICLDELEAMKKVDVLEEELENAKKYFAASLPSLFKNQKEITNLFAISDIWNRSDDHDKTYVDKLNAITIKDIKDMA